MQRAVRLSVFFIVSITTSAHGEIVTDGKMGAIQSLSGQMTIPQSLGTTAGHNLFHSFKTFNINSDEKATFTGNDSIQNVISRVTGGSLSQIEGTLKSSLANANFYFINPAGITLGTHAVIDVPAAFHLSTADELRFTDGSTFSASNPTSSTLTVAEPSNFGFLTTSPFNNALIKIDGTQITRGQSLVTVKDQSLDIVGKQISIANNALLRTNTGNISIKGSSLTVDNAKITSNSGAVTIETSDNLTLSNGGSISTTDDYDLYQRTLNPNIGNITFTTNNLNLLSGGEIFSRAYYASHAGDVNVTVNDKFTFDKAEHPYLQGISSTVHSGGVYEGNVTLNAKTTEYINNDALPEIGITTDGSTGIGQKQDFGGANIIIPQSLGSTIGNNLFHSFAKFNLDYGQKVTFTGNDTLNNVISRVTGGTPSLINGVLLSTIKHANFYFINPAGVVFGEKSQINIPANLHISTANALRFANAEFTASTVNKPNELMIADPISFGFVADSQNSSVVVNGSATSELSVTDGRTLDIVANNINIQDRTNVYAPGGKIRLVAFKGAGDVSLQADSQGDIPLPNFTPSTSNAGNIIIDGKSTVSTDGDGGGYMDLWANAINISNYGFVSANNNGASNAVSDDDSIKVVSNTLDIFNNGQLSADTLFGGGNAGTATINTSTLNFINGGAMTGSTYGAGNAGTLNIIANNFNSDGQNQHSVSLTGISASTFNNGIGNAGTIKINSNALTILGDSVIRTSTNANGNAGSITVNAHIVKIDGQAKPYFTGISSRANTGSTGNAGTVMVNAGKLDILNLGQITARTLSTGNAGNVIVMANNINIDGQNNPDNSNFPTGINAQARVDTQNANSKTFTGNAGNVIIMAKDKITLSNKAQISSSSQTAGNAGTVRVKAAQITLDNNSFITTSAISGNGGDITVDANDLIDLKNSGLTTSVTGANGKGGDINVTAHSLIMNNAVIQANAVGGSGGDINLNLQNLIPSQNQLIKGGVKVDWQPYQEGLNIIQAASQNGVSGTVNVTSPKFNISGSLTGLKSVAVLPTLTNDPCSSSAAQTSSLARAGKGGISTNETKTVFVPAISAPVDMTTNSTAIKSDISNALSLTENYPCTTLSAKSSIE